MVTGDEKPSWAGDRSLGSYGGTEHLQMPPVGVRARGGSFGETR